MQYRVNASIKKSHIEELWVKSRKGQNFSTTVDKEQKCTGTVQSSKFKKNINVEPARNFL